MKFRPRPGRTRRVDTLFLRRGGTFLHGNVYRLHAGATMFPAAIGRSGLTRRKREGDGCTPRGSFELLSGYVRLDRLARPGASIRLMALSRKDGWCDDPASRKYNRPVSLPFGFRHEKLWRDDRLYDVVLIMDYNVSLRRPGAGSAIFFHILAPDDSPTEGCIAISLSNMRKLLPRLSGKARIVVV